MNFDIIPEWPDFVTLGDDASGRIPCARIEHWAKLFEVLDGPFFNRPGTELVFRGQRRHDWTLLPSLGRSAPNGLITEELAERQLRMFRLAVRGRIADRSLFDEDQSDELWAIGQHHGLQTPLLDWTDSPYVALFFAFSTDDQKGETENPYRALYVLNKSYIQEDDCCPEVRFLEPRKDDHGRLVNQAGSFTYSPYAKTIEDALVGSLNDQEEDGPLADASEDQEANIIAQYICKIYIKNVDASNCLRHLRKMNVHHASLFPDLIGAAEHCNARIRLSGEDAGPVVITGDSEPVDTQPSPAADTALETLPTTQADEAVSEDAPSLDIPPEITSLADLIHHHGSSISGDVQDVLISEIEALLKGMSSIPDWAKRAKILASIRTKLRPMLRRANFPRESWDTFSRTLTSLLESGRLRMEASE